MSNIIPPLLSDSPPPPPDIDDHEDDEFGDFTGTNKFSYDCDESFSPPSSPLHLPKESFDLDGPPILTEVYDINSNSKENSLIFTEPPPIDKPKDFHDKRKDNEILLKCSSGTKVVDNSINNHFVEKNACQSSKTETSNSDLFGVQNKDEIFKEESVHMFNNTAPSLDEISSTSSHNSKQMELTCVQKIDDFVVTNCDIKITSNQNDASINSIEDCNETFSIDSKNREKNKRIDEFSDSSEKLDEINTSCENNGTVSDKGIVQYLNDNSNSLDEIICASETEKQGNISKISRAEDSLQQSKKFDNSEHTFKELNYQKFSESGNQAFNKLKSESNPDLQNDFENKENVFSLTLDCTQPTDSVSHNVVSEHVKNPLNEDNVPLDSVKSTPLKENQIQEIEVNDEFGDFSTTVDYSETSLEPNVRYKDAENSIEKCKDQSLVDNNDGIDKLKKKDEPSTVSNFDDFGDFTQSVAVKNNSEYLTQNAELDQSSVEPVNNQFKPLSIPLVTESSPNDDNNFADFSSTSQNPIEKNTNKLVKEDDFGDFAILTTEVEVELEDSDFEDLSISKYKSTSSSAQKDDFENFASFPSTSQVEQEDDFFDDGDDFGDFTTSTAGENQNDISSKILLLNEKQALDKSKEILKEMFPVVEASATDFKQKSLETSDKIFNQVKSITETHALSYQWPKSASQNLLLRSLNIDSRNIMFGPGWNPSMPRFAANLSQTPLEPTKSEILTPTSANESNPSNSSQAVSVEARQFDMSDLELMNPLDYLEHLVSQLEIPNFKSNASSHNSASPSDLENWDAWLQSLSSKDANNSTEKKTETSKDITKDIPVFSSLGLQPTILPETSSTLNPTKSSLEQRVTPTIQHDDFDDFVSHSISEDNPHTGHSIILRETHISNKEPNKPDENEIVSYLEPTIVTPELLRKEHKFVEAEDEFDDFQMVVAVSQAQTTTETSNTLTVKPLELLKPTGVGQSQVISTRPALGLDIFEKTTPRDLKLVEEQKPDITNTTTSVDEDFGDFTYSLPSNLNASVAPLSQSAQSHASTTPQLTSVSSRAPLAPTSVIEPLKPSVIHSQASQISWPDPGITEDEIQRFEGLNYSRVQNNPVLSEDTRTKAPVVQLKQNFEKRTVIQPNVTRDAERQIINEASYFPPQTRPYNKPPLKASQQSKQGSLDDDEWSDFVSVQNPSPVHRLKSDRERSSTPDLPLSVLNLGSVQPAKQPIPVITPNGLVQTKLSSNLSLNFPTMMQTNRTYPQPHQSAPVFQPSIQPSIISNQYANQAYGGFSNYGNYQAQSSSNTSSKTQIVDGADDEWSDFVSHQPASQRSTTQRHNQSWSNQSNQFSSWSGITPNIITNPSASFDGSVAQKQGKKLTSQGHNKKSGGSNVAIPDLDFVAPKSRTSYRK